MLIYICIGFVSVVLRPKNNWQYTRYLAYISIAIDYYFLFHISQKDLQFRKKTKVFVKENFWFPHTSNWVYLLWNCFSNYVFLKDMYITSKGIGKISFVSVLRILLICKFLNLTAVFTKRKILTFQSLHTDFRARKLISV